MACHGSYAHAEHAADISKAQMYQLVLLSCFMLANLAYIKNKEARIA